MKECISRNSQHIWTEIKGAVGGRLILWHYKNNRKWQTLHSQIARLTMSRLTNTKTINNKVMLQVVSFQDSRPQQSFGMYTHPNWSSNITSTFHFQHVHHTSIFPEKREGYFEGTKSTPNMEVWGWLLKTLLNVILDRCKTINSKVMLMLVSFQILVYAKQPLGTDPKHSS